MNCQPRQRSLIFRSVGLLLFVTVLSAAILVILPPPSPTVEFVRFTTDAAGHKTAVCRVTNRSFRPLGILGQTPTYTTVFIQDAATGKDLGTRYSCTAFEFHSLAPSQSREIHIDAGEDTRGVRYGILYNSPFESIRSLHESLSWYNYSLAWTPDTP